MGLKNNVYIFLLISLTMSCVTPVKVLQTDKQSVNNLLDTWHQDVANFKYVAYFEKMTDDAVFVGTDALEVWNKQQFMVFSKPYFDKKQTWDFKPLQRNIYFDASGKMAWFDEVLDTWMGLSRGSGVLVLTSKNGWKIKHYVLSVTVPNEDIKSVIEAKKDTEKTQIQKFVKL
jgi:ketosteroid isomerase-like protein